MKDTLDVVGAIDDIRELRIRLENAGLLFGKVEDYITTEDVNRYLQALDAAASAMMSVCDNR